MILLVTIVMHLRSFSSGGTTKFLTWTWTWTVWRSYVPNLMKLGP